MKANFKNALISAVLAALVVLPIFGLHLERKGARNYIEPHWNLVIWGFVIVLVLQLIKPFLAKQMAHIKAPSLPTMKQSTRTTLLWLVIVAAIVWPFFSGRNAVDIATLALIYVMLGLGLNIVVGFAGLLDLGFVGFYAVGAYTYAMLFHWAGWSFWQALPLSGAAAALFGFLLGFPVLRLRGDYLAIVTLGFGEIIRLLLVNLVDYTGGPDGISSIPKPTLFGYELTRTASTEGANPAANAGDRIQHHAHGDFPVPAGIALGTGHAVDQQSLDSHAHWPCVGSAARGRSGLQVAGDEPHQNQTVRIHLGCHVCRVWRCFFCGTPRHCQP